MKKLFFLSIIICAASFVMAVITDGIFNMGGLWTWDFNWNSHSSYWTDIPIGNSTIFDENVCESSEWNINNEFDFIHLYSAAVRTEVVPTNADKIHVSASVPDGKNINVSARWYGNELYIEAHPRNVTFDDIFEGGVINWLDDLMGDGSGIVIRIEIPEQVLQCLYLRQGSGTTVVRGIDTQDTIIDIGSGTVNYQGTGNFCQNSFTLNMGSGKACITDMLTKNYYIDIGSGRFAISGLSGEGTIDIGSGSGSVFYSNFDGYADIDIGSGILNMYVPNNTSALVYTDIGSGRVNIDACGVNTKLSDNGDCVLGSGSDYIDIPQINIDMGSGNVNILDYSDEAEQNAVAEFAVDDPAAAYNPSGEENSVFLPPVEESSDAQNDENTAIIGDTISAIYGLETA